MADEVRQYTITVPAGTLDTAPLTFPMAMPPRQVEALQIVVPPGPSGFVGFAVLVGGGRVIPYQSDAWIVTAGENITWPLEHMPNSGAWSVLAYNTGAQDHSIYFRWLLKYLGAGAAAPGLDTLPESDINALSPQSIPLV
jgi:hypothetical protein